MIYPSNIHARKKLTSECSVTLQKLMTYEYETLGHWDNPINNFKETSVLPYNKIAPHSVDNNKHK